jgi:3-ketosteroid 9alpha-monooxygenase subunit B
VFSILRHALEQSTARVTLFYANRDEKSVIFRDALNALANAHPQRLQVIHWLDSVQGIPSVAQLAEFARPQAHAQAFICGPGPFMDAAVAALNSVNMPEADIHVERFVSLPDEAALAAAQTARQNEAPRADAVDEAQVVIAIDGQLHTIECSGQETILEAAQRVKLNLPFSCQAGMCASCMCQVVEGSVHLRHNDVLDAKDLAKSWTLACQAVPTSTHLRLKFPE